MERTPTATITSLIAAAGIGALAMFLLDPQSGTRRVALARDQARRLAREARDSAGTGWRDLRHRMAGVAAGARHLMHHDDAPDRVLEERVRAELGRWVSHPHAVTVTVRNRRVLLGGCVLAAEQAQMTRAAEGVRGVLQVDSQVVAYDSPDGMPMLQGGTARSGRAPPWPRGERHSPATQLLRVSASMALVAGGALRGGVPGLLLVAAGAALAADVTRVRRRLHNGAAHPATPYTTRAAAEPVRDAAHAMARAAASAVGSEPLRP